MARSCSYAEMPGIVERWDELQREIKRVWWANDEHFSWLACLTYHLRSNERILKNEGILRARLLRIIFNHWFLLFRRCVRSCGRCLDLKTHAEQTLKNIRVRNRAKIETGIVTIVGQKRSIGCGGKNLSDQLFVTVHLKGFRIAGQNVSNHERKNFVTMGRAGRHLKTKQAMNRKP